MKDMVFSLPKSHNIGLCGSKFIWRNKTICEGIIEELKSNNDYQKSCIERKTRQEKEFGQVLMYYFKKHGLIENIIEKTTDGMYKSKTK